jgi:hypothetical protein
LKTIIRYSFYDNNSIRSMYVRQTKNWNAESLEY